VLAKYVAQIVLALRYMHYNCVVYRDLKAENIMIDENDNIKLGDLGLAKYDCDNDLSNLAGTVEYLAPEVAGKRKYGRACDYYSLAVLVYHLQTGRLPYKHKKEQKEAFIKQLAAGKQKIASTGNASADELIRILSDYDPVQRWSNVYVNFEKFKGLKYFDGIDWNMLEDISANQY
jgi:serine/threonine protein kinase